MSEIKTAKELLSMTPKQRIEMARERGRIDKKTLQESKDIGKGILIPSAFQVPNEIVDDGWLEVLTGAELKVLLYIIRKTFGFNKIIGDYIPLSQIMDGVTVMRENGEQKHFAGTGLKKTAVTDALLTLEKAGLIKVVRMVNADGTKKTNYYQLVTREDYTKK